MHDRELGFYIGVALYYLAIAWASLEFVCSWNSSNSKLTYFGLWGLLDVCNALLQVVATLRPPGKHHPEENKSVDCCSSNAGITQRSALNQSEGISDGQALNRSPVQYSCFAASRLLQSQGCISTATQKMKGSNHAFLNQNSEIQPPNPTPC